MKIQEIEVNKIEGNPYQTRRVFDEDSLKALCKSIRENGLINPINVTKKDGKYFILSGHRRFECFRKLKINTIPCIVKIVMDSGFKINMAHENLMRDDLQPLEKADTIKLLIADKIKNTRNDVIRMIQLINKLKNWKKRGTSKFEKLEGFDKDDIFRMMNILKSLNLSENNTIMYLSVLALPKKIQLAISWRKGQLIDEGKIKISHAEQLVRVRDEEYRNYLFEKCINDHKFTRERLRSLVDKHIIDLDGGNYNKKNHRVCLRNFKSDLDKLKSLQEEFVKLSKHINTFNMTALQKLDETFEKNEFVSEVGGLKKELLKLLGNINMKLEGYDVYDFEKQSTVFKINVVNAKRSSRVNDGKINGGKRFTFPYRVSQEMNLPLKSELTVKVIDAKERE